MEVRAVWILVLFLGALVCDAEHDYVQYRIRPGYLRESVGSELRLSFNSSANWYHTVYAARDAAGRELQVSEIEQLSEEFISMLDLDWEVQQHLFDTTQFTMALATQIHATFSNAGVDCLFKTTKMLDKISSFQSKVGNLNLISVVDQVAELCRSLWDNIQSCIPSLMLKSPYLDPDAIIIDLRKSRSSDDAMGLLDRFKKEIMEIASSAKQNNYQSFGRAVGQFGVANSNPGKYLERMNITAPSCWKCDPAEYGADDGCDCECGCWDPDCNEKPQFVFNCWNSTEAIPSTMSVRCVPAGNGTCFNQTVPASWNCSTDYYDANDGCDCGCGAYDPDCSNSTVVYGCGGNSDAQCSASGVCLKTSNAPDNWTCDPDFYDANDGCDCNCGTYDPDCDTVSDVVYGCPCVFQTCMQPGVCTGECNGYYYVATPVNPSSGGAASLPLAAFSLFL